MSGGLVLSLASGERFLVNGVLLENGDKPSRIRIADPDVRVLRCRDTIEPSDVTTPVRRVYFAIQLFISGDLDPEHAKPALLRECEDLADAFQPINETWIPDLVEMIKRRNFYSALCHLKPIMAIEDELLKRGKESSDARVAA